MTATQIRIRSLTYADLPQVIAIERRSFTTPSIREFRRMASNHKRLWRSQA